jgi:uncharacterized membrane protein YqaE (UPF0057 family)
MDIVKMIISPVLDLVLMVFDPIIGPIMAIVDFFIMLIKILEWLAYFIVWTIFFIGWVFIDLLNPINFIADFTNSLILIIYTFFSSIFQILMTLLAFSTNFVGGWMQGIWGWDQSGLTKTDRDSNYFKNIDRNKGKKCYLTQSNTVPFSIILGTILCPPIGVFMELGISGWLNILVCCMLTLFFYLPGLVYALLIVYS